MNNLYEALEVCLEAMDHGMDIETSLARYPDIADELRPIIQASLNAKGMAVHSPSANVIRRNRAKFLQRATEMRKTMVKPTSTRIWFSSIRRIAVALSVLLIVLMTGTGLVRASSTTLPGDNLYQVKRTWEDVTLLFTFDLQRRESLEVEHENERLEELQELMAEGRSAKVDFAGIVTQQNGNAWLISGIAIVISPKTDFHDGPVFIGDAVRVFGITQSDASVLAERIDHLPSDAQLPDTGNSGKGSDRGSNSGSGSSNDDNGNDVADENDSSGPGNGKDNGNDNNSGPGAGSDNSNDDSSGSSGGNDNDNNSGSGGGNDDVDDNNSGSDSSNDNSNEDNSGSGGGIDNSNENDSGSGSANDNSSDDGSNSGEDGGED
jgi:hypothetical protein